MELTASTPTASDTICGYESTGNTEASASEKEEMVGRNDMVCSHQKWRKQECGILRRWEGDCTAKSVSVLLSGFLR